MSTGAPRWRAAEPDLTPDPVFQRALQDAAAALGPGAGDPVDLQDPQPSPNRLHVAMVGAVADLLDGTPPQRVCVLDLAEQRWRFPLPDGGSQRSPRWSPCGRWLAFAARTDRAAGARLVIWDSLASSPALPRCPDLPGAVESIQWIGSAALLLVVTGVTADLAAHPGARPAGATAVDDGSPATAEPVWRRAWWYDIASDRAVPLSPPALNVWEAAWCPGRGLLVLASDHPGEDAWYGAHLAHYPVCAAPPGQLPCTAIAGDRRWKIGSPASADGFALVRAAPDGRHAAFVQGCCSDRQLPSGMPWLLDMDRGTSSLLHDAGADVTHLVWDGDEALLFAGLRGLETVVGRITREGTVSNVIWAGTDLTIGPPRGPECAPWTAGHALALTEGFVQAPALQVLAEGRQRRLWSAPAMVPLPHGLASQARRWTAPDGLAVDGWLLTPDDDRSRPCVVELHGGPVWAHRPLWLGRAAALPRLTLLRGGFALLLPNPRGSSGRGQRFARAVVHDLGGAEVQDILAGIDALVADGRIDPDRLCAWGISHGGFLSAWMACTTQRFAAVAPVSPVTDWIAEHASGPIPAFCAAFVGPLVGADASTHAARSPLLRASDVRAAVMTVAGGHDPGVQAQAWHGALTQAGQRSLLLTYPLDGHGIRTLPALADFATRLALWFREHGADVPARDAG